MNWPAFCKHIILADGRIEAAATATLRKAIEEDRVVDQEEADFLVELKRGAIAVCPEFDRFFLDVLKKIVLKDGVISDTEARWLRRSLLADRQLNVWEMEFLDDLKKSADSYGPVFEAFYKEATEAPDWDESPS